jgi:predicted O-methyltransferase YrrM
MTSPVAGFSTEISRRPPAGAAAASGARGWSSTLAICQLLLTTLTVCRKRLPEGHWFNGSMIRTAPVQQYLDGLRPPRDPLFEEMEELARRDRVPIVEWETGRLLATLVAALQPRLVLEVGTAIGYSTLHMARAMEGEGRIVTLERDPERIALARGFFARDEAGQRIDLVEGDALESLQRLDGPFDLVFVDASKGEIPRYLELAAGRMSPRAVLAIDNLLMGGQVADGVQRSSQWAEESLAAARAVTRELMASPDWLFSLLPVGDGVGLGVRRAGP